MLLRDTAEIIGACGLIAVAYYIGQTIVHKLRKHQANLDKDL